MAAVVRPPAHWATTRSPYRPSTGADALREMVRHLRAVRRCILAAVPRAWAARARCRELTDAFRSAVEPILAETMSDDARRDDLASRLLPWAIQGGYLVDAYAQLATHRRSPRLAVLAATFTRLYDDLLDETTDDTVGDRLGRLFAGGDLGAVSERECVLERVYRTLAELTPRQLHEPSYRALADLHRRQIQSLRQAGGPLTTTQLWDLTTAKGGLAMVVLGGLTRPQLTDAEVDRLYQLGGLLQLVDDYQDEGVDRRRGIRTLATSGVLMFNALAGRLRRLDGQYCATYGAASAKSFIDDLYLWLYVVGLVRLLRGRQSTPIRTGAKRRALAKNIVVLRRDAIR